MNVEQPPGALPQQLLALSDEELYELLGSQVSPQMHGVDPKMLAAIAKAWLRDRWEELRETVCANDAVHSAQLAVGTEQALVVSAVADAITSIAFGPAAMTAAVLLVRFGLDRLCPGE